jgi:hypothetical protein
MHVRVAPSGSQRSIGVHVLVADLLTHGEV